MLGTDLLHSSVVITLRGESYRLRDHTPRPIAFRRATPVPAKQIHDTAIRWGISVRPHPGTSMSASHRPLAPIERGSTDSGTSTDSENRGTANSRWGAGSQKQGRVKRQVAEVEGPGAEAHQVALNVAPDVAGYPCDARTPVAVRLHVLGASQDCHLILDTT